MQIIVLMEEDDEEEVPNSDHEDWEIMLLPLKKSSMVGTRDLVSYSVRSKNESESSKIYQMIPPTF